jgi:hypothetical protein
MSKREREREREREIGSRVGSTIGGHILLSHDLGKGLGVRERESMIAHERE